MTAREERTGARGVKLSVPKDPTAPALGRIVALPDGTRAVLVAQGYGDEWHGQRLGDGSFVSIQGTRPDRRTGARAFPVVGHYADGPDVLAAEAPTLDGLDYPACAACLCPRADHIARPEHYRHPYTFGARRAS